MAYGAGYDAQPPQAYTTAQSPQTYADAQPTQTPKRGKTGLIVGIIVAAVIVLGGVGVGGYFVYQNMAGDAQAARELSGNGSGNDPAAASDAAADDPAAADSGSEPAPPSGADTSSRIDPNTLIADFQNPYVILDEEDIKITIDVGSGEGGDSEYFYKVRCVVENKTDREYGITLRDASASNQVGDYLFATLSKSRIDGNPAHNRSMNFLPGGNLAHFELSKDDFEGSITDFKAKLFLSEVESRNVISEYMISAPAM
jgi:cytoskeletal protein RodZ